MKLVRRVAALLAGAVLLGLPSAAQAAPPAAFFDYAESVSATSTNFFATVATGDLNTSGSFQYALNSSTFCTSNGAGGSPSVTNPPQVILGSNDDGEINAAVTGLTGGEIYCVRAAAQNSAGTAYSALERFTAGQPSASTFDVQITGASTVNVLGDVNAAGQATQVRVRYGLRSSTFCSTFGNSGEPDQSTAFVDFAFTDAQDHDVSLPVTGLTPGQDYCAVIEAKNASGTSERGIPENFAAGLPDARLFNLSSSAATTAVAEGVVFTANQATQVVAKYALVGSDYCDSDGDEGSPAGTSPAVNVAAATSDTDVTVPIPNLTAGAEYCVTLVATNGTGASRFGNFLEVKVGVPGVVTDFIQQTGATTATVNGTVNPAGQATTYSVRYDLIDTPFCDGDTDTASFTAAGATVSGQELQGVSVSLTGLTAGTEYCASLAATNGSGTTVDDYREAFVSGAPVAFISDVTITSNTSATVLGEVNPTGQTTKYRVRYGLESSEFCESFGDSGTPASQTPEVTLGFTDTEYHEVSVNLTALQTDADYCAQLVATNGSGSDFDFDSFRVVQLPIVLALTAEATGTTTERLSGTVNPNGVATTYQFEYGLNNSQWCSTDGDSGSPLATTPSPAASLGSGTSTQSVTAQLSGLTPGAAYCWALKAISPNGTVVDGPSGNTFVVGLPVVTTQAASGLSNVGATLNGTVNPSGNVTSFAFAYAPATSLFCTSNGIDGDPTATTTQTPVGFTDTTAHPVSTQIVGLNAGTQYCYRVLASNAAGTATGPNVTFTTTGGVVVTPTATASATATATATATASATATATATTTATATASPGGGGGGGNPTATATATATVDPDDLPPTQVEVEEELIETSFDGAKSTAKADSSNKSATIGFPANAFPPNTQLLATIAASPSVLAVASAAVTVGKATAVVVVGKATTLKVPLSKKAKKKLAKAGKFKATLSLAALAPSGASATSSQPITIKGKKKPKKK